MYMLNFICYTAVTIFQIKISTVFVSTYGWTNLFRLNYRRGWGGIQDADTPH